MTQAAALAAATGPQDVVTQMREAYRSRRDVAVDTLRAGGVDLIRPEGAFYAMVPLPDGVESRTAALELVGAGVSFAPGSAFGRNAPHHLRISLATSEAGIREGLRRFLAWREDAALCDPAGRALDGASR